MGSNGPKKMIPIPIPAANSMAAHDAVEYSGRSPSRPSGIRP